MYPTRTCPIFILSSYLRTSTWCTEIEFPIFQMLSFFLFTSCFAPKKNIPIKTIYFGRDADTYTSANTQRNAITDCVTDSLPYMYDVFPRLWNV